MAGEMTRRVAGRPQVSKLYDFFLKNNLGYEIIFWVSLYPLGPAGSVKRTFGISLQNVITRLFLGIMFMRNNFILMWSMIVKGFGPTCFTA
jgi:hypothetical protein